MDDLTQFNSIHRPIRIESTKMTEDSSRDISKRTSTEFKVFQSCANQVESNIILYGRWIDLIQINEKNYKNTLRFVSNRRLRSAMCD